MFDFVYTVGFSGNRPKDVEGRTFVELSSMRDKIAEVLDVLESKANSQMGHIEFVSSVADGADLIACEVTIEKEIPLHIILPKSPELFAEDFSNSDPSVLPRVQTIIRHGNQCINGSSFRVSSTISSSPECYQITNKRILDTSDVLFFLYNGDTTIVEGGVVELLQQAKALDKPYVIINTLEAVQPDLSNSDRVFSDQSNQISNEVLQCITNKTLEETNSSLKSVIDKLDRAATSSSKWFRRAITLSILLHGLAAIIAAVAVSYAATLNTISLAILAGVELLMVISAVLLIYWHNNHHTQSSWLHCRFASELMKGYWVGSGIRDPLLLNLSHLDLKWHRLALSASIHAHKESVINNLSFDAIKERYVNIRIQDQRKYFEGQAKRVQPLYVWLTKIMHWTSIAAILAVGAAFAVKLIPSVFAQDVKEMNDSYSSLDSLKILAIFFLPVALPLIAGISNSIITSLDIGRRSIRYKALAKYFDEQFEYFRTIKSKEVLKESVIRVEDVLLFEIIEWLSAAETGKGH